jgi:Cu2+-exporting ATPase
MNVMMLSISVWSGVSEMLLEQRDFFHWLSALIVLPDAAYAGQFFLSAFRALRTRNVDMDPSGLGVTLAPAMSLVETWHHADHVYFRCRDHAADVPVGRRYLDQSMRLKMRAVALTWPRSGRSKRAIR